MVVTLLVMLAFQLIPWLAAIPYCGAAALSPIKEVGIRRQTPSFQQVKMADQL